MKDIPDNITQYRQEHVWTESQRKLLKYWARLTAAQQAAVLALIETM